MMAELQIALIMGLSALVFSVAGFGFGLVSVPLLSLVLPIQEAVALQFPVSLALVLYNAWRYRRDFHWRSLVPLAVGATVAMPLGMLSLAYLPAAALKIALALFIVAAVVNGRLEVGRRWAGRFAATPTMGVFMGLLSGWFGGAYTTGGPPAAVYAMAVAQTPAETKGVLGAYLAYTDIFVLAMYVWAGFVTWPVVGHAALHAPAVALGMVVGGLLLRGVGERLYRDAADVLLLVSAALLGVNA